MQIRKRVAVPAEAGYNTPYLSRRHIPQLQIHAFENREELSFRRAVYFRRFYLESQHNFHKRIAKGLHFAVPIMNGNHINHSPSAA